MIGVAAAAGSSRGADSAWHGCNHACGIGCAWPTSQLPDGVMAACQPSWVSWRVRAAGSRATLMSRWRVPSRSRGSTTSPDPAAYVSRPAAAGWSSTNRTRPLLARALRSSDQNRPNADSGTCESQKAKKMVPKRRACCSSRRPPGLVLPGVLWHAAWPLIALPGLRCWLGFGLGGCVKSWAGRAAGRGRGGWRHGGSRTGMAAPWSPSRTVLRCRSCGRTGGRRLR